jgi:16S rRNA (guanine527-N7)-methyltransferase
LDNPVEKVLRDGLEQLALPLPDNADQTLLAYVDLLARWNRSYNLTAVRDPAEMVTRHVLDSLAVMPWLDADRLLDVGAGAGLPGIPLAIANPSLDVTLVDSAGKKVRFMNHARRQLGLSNVHPVDARVENYGPERPFDAVISRAFSNLEAFVASVRHLVAAEGRLLAMKGHYPAEEIDALPAGIQVNSVEKMDVPGLHENRHLVIMSLVP